VHAALGKAQADRVPVVAMNASFDITIAAMLFRSFGLEPIEWRALVDPLVIDRKVDCFRAGKRRLDALCEIYQVALGSPHDAGSDADATLSLARTIAYRYPEIAKYEIGELTKLQPAGTGNGRSNTTHGAGRTASRDLLLRSSVGLCARSSTCTVRPVAERGWPLSPTRRSVSASPALTASTRARPQHGVGS